MENIKCSQINKINGNISIFSFLSFISYEQKTGKEDEGRQKWSWRKLKTIEKNKRDKEILKRKRLKGKKIESRKKKKIVVYKEEERENKAGAMQEGKIE